MPLVSGAAWNPALPTGTSASSSQSTPVTQAQVVGGLDRPAGPGTATCPRTPVPASQGLRSTGEVRRAAARSPAARAARVWGSSWTIETDTGPLWGVRRASRRGSRRRPCRAAFWSFLRSLVESRSPKTVPRVWSVSCCRQRASRPSPENVDGLAVQAGAASPSRSPAGRTATNAPGKDRQPSSSSSSRRSRPSGSVSTGLQTTPDGVPTRLVGAVEDEDRQVDADLAGGQPDAVGGVHRRDHVGDQRAQLLVVRRHRLLRPVHDRGSPAGHRTDGAALGERAVRRGRLVVGHGGDSLGLDGLDHRSSRAATVTRAHRDAVL